MTGGTSEIVCGAPAFGATAGVDVIFIMPGRRVQGIALATAKSNRSSQPSWL